MLSRAAFGLVIVLASVSGSLAAPRAHATADAQTVYNPSGASVPDPRSHSESAPTVWGWPVYVPPSDANVAKPRSHSESALTGTIWGWPVYAPLQERAYGRVK